MNMQLSAIRNLGFLLVASSMVACAQKTSTSAHYTVSPASSSSGLILSEEIVNVSNVPKQLAPGQTYLIQPTGGVAPYTFTALSASGGQLASNYESALFTAGSTSANVQIQVSDVNGAGVTVVLTVKASLPAPTPILSVGPGALSVWQYGFLSLNATGGVAPYTYTVISPDDVYSGGYFSGNIYHAPSMASTAIISVTDSIGNQLYTTISVGH